MLAQALNRPSRAAGSAGGLGLQAPPPASGRRARARCGRGRRPPKSPPRRILSGVSSPCLRAPAARHTATWCSWPSLQPSMVAAPKQPSVASRRCTGWPATRDISASPACQRWGARIGQPQPRAAPPTLEPRAARPSCRPEQRSRAGALTTQAWLADSATKAARSGSVDSRGSMGPSACAALNCLPRGPALPHSPPRLAAASQPVLGRRPGHRLRRLLSWRAHCRSWVAVPR